MERETQTKNIASNRVVQQCANCKRRQSNFLIQKYGKNSDYFIHFHICLSDELMGGGFKSPGWRVTRGTRILGYMLCSQYKQHLSHLDKKEYSKYNHCWPAFFWTLLQNKSLHKVYGSTIFRFIPWLFWCWWVDVIISLLPDIYSGISILISAPIFNDIVGDIGCWNEEMEK